MTNPCSFSDLPQPYEPIVNFKGIPALEYNFPSNARPPLFTIDECLALNTVSERHSRDQNYFFGELVPPYIDILGRGPHFRPSDEHSLKYQQVAKCYKNSQPLGSHVYQRMASYYGPQFDIQTGYPQWVNEIPLLLVHLVVASNTVRCSFCYVIFQSRLWIQSPEQSNFCSSSSRGFWFQSSIWLLQREREWLHWFTKGSYLRLKFQLHQGY